MRSQCAERVLNNIAKPLNDTFTGLVYILKGFRIQCLAKKLVFLAIYEEKWGGFTFK